MKNNNKKYFIIDFDSTFIKTETLDELAEYALRKNPDKEKLLARVKDITARGMTGEIPFSQSLKTRLSLLAPTRQDVDSLGKVIKKKISNSVVRNKNFFRKFKDSIYIISGGFKEIIVPAVLPFGIKEDHVLANTFIFDRTGKYKGYDMTNPLSGDNGKIKAVKSLKLQGEITIVGDGYTDYQLKESGLASKFIAFIENIEREKVSEKADQVVSSFDELLYLNKLPMSISYPKNRINVLLLENIEKSAVKYFEDEGYTVSYYSKSLPEDELIQKLANTHILGIRSRTQISEEVLKNAPRLLALGAYCIGTNQIDLPAAATHGTAVFNAPYSNTRSVVELAIGFIFALSRDFVFKNNDLHQGIWNKSAQGLHEVRGKTLGIIGYGNIGSQLSVLAENLGMKVIYYDIVDRLALGNAKSCATLNELLRKSDIITVHVDGRKQNKNLITEKEFRAMKDGVKFINTSRGFVVDIRALVANLKNGKIKSAALDVFPVEPKGKDEEFKSELREFPNVILTPHIGAGTEEAQKNIADYVSRKIIDYINTGNTYLSVNLPNLQVIPQNKSHRILHIHRNVPGILAGINSILAKNNINILGQYLKTNEEIGYVITDVNKEYAPGVLDELKDIAGTIKLRVLY